MHNESTIAHLEQLRDEFYRKYKSIDDTLKVLKDGTSTSPNTKQQSLKSDGYNISWPMKLKLSHVLKSQGKFLHIRQIGEILHNYEPAISDKDFINKLYPAIAELKKTNTT